MLERMARLEETIKTSSSIKGASPMQADSAATVSSAATNQQAGGFHQETPEDDYEIISVQRKRRRTLPLSPGAGSCNSQEPAKPLVLQKETDEEESQGPEDRKLANLDLRRYLRLDRQNCDNDRERQQAIDAAIRLAKSAAMAEPPLQYDRGSNPNLYDPSMYPTAEFLYLLVNGKLNEPLGAQQI